MLSFGNDARISIPSAAINATWVPVVRVYVVFSSTVPSDVQNAPPIAFVRAVHLSSVLAELEWKRAESSAPGATASLGGCPQRS